MKKLYLVLILFSLVATATDAQSFYAVRREKSLILLVGTGSSSYFGELKNKNSIDPRLNIDLGLQYYISDRVSLRSEVTWFNLKGDDKDADDESRKRRNLSFKSSNFEVNVTGAVNLWANGNRYYRRPAFNIYGFGGLGYLFFNPKADLNGTAYALQPLMTEGKKYSKSTIVIPFGLGARLKVGPSVNLAIEGGYRKTFTDYLDDVSTVYQDPANYISPLAATLANRNIDNEGNPNLSAGAAGKQRGDPAHKDAYFTLNLKLEYYLPGDIQLFGQRKPGYRKRSSFSRYKGGRVRR